MVDFKKAGIRSIFLFVLKSILLIVIAMFIYLKFREKSSLVQDFSLILRDSLQHTSVIAWVGVCLLMPVNWLMEAKKWQGLAQEVVPMSLRDALAGVLSGLSLSFVTPHALGDYAAKVWQTEHADRGHLIGAVLLGRWIQLGATLLFGTIGLSYLMIIWGGGGFLLGYFGLVLVFFLVSVFLLRKKLNDFARSDKGWIRKIYPYVAVLNRYGQKALIAASVWAVLRYMVFSSQFLMVLSLFRVDLPWDVLYAGVTWTLLAKSVLPTFNFLSDLGVREFSALYFFSHFSVDGTRVIMASLLLWVLNLLIPTIMGMFFVYRMKIIRKG